MPEEAEDDRSTPVAQSRLSNGRDVALVDASDFPKVSRFKWHAQRIKGTHTYATCNIGKDEARSLGFNVRETPKQKDRPGKQYTRLHLHLFIMGHVPGTLIDHRSGDTMDCRRSNLRRCSAGNNATNKVKTGSPTSSQFKGVHWSKHRKKWVAEVQKDKRSYRLGGFANEIDAARAYDAAALRLHGSFARFNFSEETT